MAILGDSKITKLRVGTETPTPSTSVDTGDLVVTGGAGVGGDFNVGGSINGRTVETTLTDDDTKIPTSGAVYESTIKNITADAEHVSSDAPVDVTVTPGADRTTNLHFKIPAGKDAVSIRLSSESYVFPCEPNGCPKPETYTVTANKQNINEATSWSLSNGLVYTGVDSIKVTPDDMVATTGSNLAVTDGTTGDEEYKWGSSTSSGDTVNFKTTNLPLGKIYRFRARCNVTASTSGKVYLGYTGFNDSSTHWDSVYENVATGNQTFSLVMYAGTKATADPHFMLYTENCTLTIEVASTELFEATLRDSLDITATAGTVSDSISIVPVKDGLIGSSPYFLIPTADNFTFSADKEGNVPSNELTTIGSFQIFKGDTEENLADWAITGTFQPTANFKGTVTADGSISVSEFAPASDIGYIIINAVKGEESLTKTLRCTKAKSGDSPLLMVLENGFYLLTMSGGANPVLETPLPVAVSAVRIMDGNTEQTFSVNGTDSGWNVSAVFMGILESGTTTEDSSVFNGSIQTDGTIVVSTFSSDITEGEIIITASNTTLNKTLTGSVSIRVQRSAGFGTPQVETSTLPTGQDATANVELVPDSPEYEKSFKFSFGIPRGPEPIFMSMSQDTVAVSASMSGYVDPNIQMAGVSSIRIYQGTTDITNNGWTFYATDSSSDSVLFNVSTTGVIDLVGWTSASGSGADSYIKHVSAMNQSDGTTLTKSIMFYKAKAGEGTPGEAAGFGQITATLTTDSVDPSPRVTVVTSGPNNAKNFAFTFYNVGASVQSASDTVSGVAYLYNALGTQTNGGITPNAVRTALANHIISKAVYTSTFTASTSSYQVPNYVAGQDVEVVYNGLVLIEDVQYSLNTSTGLITFTNALGGGSTSQTLSVIVRSYLGGENG